jgi:predicted negative regulator of RcsB-dependent stress response
VAAQFSRQDLKTDRFKVEVEHTVDYFALHRSQVVKIVAGVLALAVIAGGIYLWRDRQAGIREQKLGEALLLQDAPVGPLAPPFGPSFPTEQAKQEAVTRAFQTLANDYPGTHQGSLAQFYLGSADLKASKLDDARKHFQTLADSSDKEYGSLAKLSLAQIAYAQNRPADGEKLLRDLIANPTELVSEDQAKLLLATYLGKTNPAQARALLQPLLTKSGAVAQEANTAFAALNTK